jgi:threonine aldolase
MREAMLAAPLGDDVFGDDPSRQCAAGKDRRPAGLRGRAVRAHRHAEQPLRHPEPLPARRRIHRRPDGALLPLGRRRRGGVRQRAAAAAEPPGSDGTLALAEIEAAIKPDDAHFARTRLLALENTLGGKVLPFDYVQQATALAKKHGLAATSTARGCSTPPSRRPRKPAATRWRKRAHCGCFDSVSVCFSKGLGAPVGSALCGSREFIARAHRIRKMAGGGMRQSGMLAAAANTRWTTTSGAWPKTMRWPSAWPTAWPASKACRSKHRRPTSCLST